MTQHSWKSSDFIEVKTNLQRCISRIILFIKTAVSIKDRLDPGPQPLADLRHGVPFEEPHHLLYLLDQILGFVARLCNDPYFRFAPHKISKRVTIRRAGRPDLLLPHLRSWDGFTKKISLKRLFFTAAVRNWKHSGNIAVTLYTVSSGYTLSRLIRRSQSEISIWKPWLVSRMVIGVCDRLFPAW